MLDLSMQIIANSTISADFLIEGGATGALSRAHDWRATSVGDPRSWPPAIRSALATMLTAPQQMFIAWGPDLTFFFNDAFRPLLGARLDGALGQPFAELWPEFWPDIEPIVAKALRGEGSRLENLPLISTRNGYPEPTWWSFSYMPLRDERGAVVGMFCVVEEATDRVLAQIASREREARQQFRSELGDALRGATDPRALTAIAAEKLGCYLDTGCVGYAVVDPSGDHVTVDEDWCSDGSVSVVGTHRLDDFGRGMAASLRAGRIVRINDAATDPLTVGSTPTAYAGIATRALIDTPLIRDGRLAGILFVNHPQPRIWTDDEVALIEEVGERTWTSLQRLRAEEALRQSQKMEAVGQLTGGLAHDFNNLLTGITGSLEILHKRLEQGRTQELGRYIGMAQDAARRAASLTHRLLAFSRRQTLSPRPTDLNHLIAGMEELISRTVGPHIAVRVAAAGSLWTTLIDAHQMENALLNLCINARDAMPAGGRLLIEAANTRSNEHDLPPGDYVVLSVTDTGAGMTAEVARRAFDPFFTTKPIGVGTGLGLSMIHGFAQQSGGQARIHSEPGQGTMVCLHLPRHQGVADPDPAPVQPGETPTPGFGETVLVVDDEPTIRALVAETLVEVGYTAIEAADGVSGLGILRSGARIDLLITDVGLPGGMNGRQLADAARTLRPELKVLFITGYAEATVIREGELEPGMHVLTKPFTLKTLTRRIRNLLAAP